MSGKTLSPLFSWRSTVLDSDLPAPAKLVALTLSTHMSERGDSCFPSQTTLATETSLGKSTICRHLTTLEERGFLLRDVGAKGRSTRYTATLPSGAAPGLPSPALGVPSPAAGHEVVKEGTSKETLSPAARKRDLVWDTLEVLFGTPLPSQKTVHGRAVRDIRTSMPDETDEVIAFTIRAKASTYRQKFPDAALTLHALVKHWGSLGVNATAAFANERHVDCPGCIQIGVPAVGCIDCGGSGRLRVS